jgi:hypothetical protein
MILVHRMEKRESALWLCPACKLTKKRRVGLTEDRQENPFRNVLGFRFPVYYIPNCPPTSRGSCKDPPCHRVAPEVARENVHEGFSDRSP